MFTLKNSSSQSGCGLTITSAQPKEGKTTAAMTLAITFAQAGRKVLLIDADLRNPSLHRLLRLDNSPGLTHYLAADAEPVEVAHPVLLDNLFVIPSGPLPPNPVELLSTPKMAALLSLATGKFDQVILDCPPVLGLADALVLSNMAQATLLVMEAGVTTRPVIQDAMKRLRSARVHIRNRSPESVWMGSVRAQRRKMPCRSELARESHGKR